MDGKLWITGVLTLAPVVAGAQNAQSGPATQAQLAPTAGTTEPQAMPVVNVIGVTDPNGIPPAYPGGQVAQGARLGILGNRDILDTPFNMTSYTDELIRNQQARTIADVVANDPSVRNLVPASNGADGYYIRGFPVSNQDVAFDGLYGILPFWRTSVISAERIEVLKGPSALLTGMAPDGAIGGSINVVPKRAGDAPLTRLTTDYFSDGQFGGMLDLGRRFGPDNRFGIRLNAAYRDGDAALDNTSQRFSELALGLDYRGDRARVSLDFGYQERHLKGVEGAAFLAPGVTDIPSPPKSRSNYYDSFSYWKDETTYGVLRGEYDLKPKLTAYAAVGGRDYSDKYLLPSARNLTSNGNFTENFTRTAEYYHNVTAETGLRGEFDTGPVNHQFNLNFNTFNQESGQVFAFGAPAGVAPHASNLYDPVFVSEPDMADLGVPAKTSETKLRSYALTDTLSILDKRVQLTVAARRQQVIVDGFNGTTGARIAHYDEHAWTPAFTLVVKPLQNFSLYANYIQGLSQGPTAPATAINAGQIFPPFKSKQYEAGMKYDWGNFASTLSVFQIKLPSSFTDPSTNVFALNGEQRNRGVEFNTFGELVSGVRVLGGVMFLDGDLQKTANGTYNGNTAPNTAHTNVNLGVEWDTPFVRGLTLSTRMIYTSSVYVDQANTQEVPSWTRFDAGARYAFKVDGHNVTLRANINNLFNRNYWMSSSLYRGSPRTVMLSASVDF
jgi:iron complex outermembrane receptor protein